MGPDVSRRRLPSSRYVLGRWRGVREPREFADDSSEMGNAGATLMGLDQAPTKFSDTIRMSPRFVAT